MRTKPIRPRGFNYIYFGIYFVFLALMSASGIFAKDPLTGSRFFFFLYAIGQAAIETSLLVFAAYFLQHFVRSRPLFMAFIGATFALFVLHILDFVMDRILDLSIWGTISFVKDETFSSFLYLLDASGVPMWGWIAMFTTLACLPFLGVFLYKISEKFTRGHRLPLRFEFFSLVFFCLPTALFFWDYSVSRIIHPNAYTSFLQSTPWKFTFLQPKNTLIEIPKPAMPMAEQEIRLEIERSSLGIDRRPNIYLFVIESFRSDSITPEIAPNLFAFKNAAVPIQIPLSNANSSHNSWFSLFYSQFSHYWHLLQEKNWSMGSPPLQLLKKLGYKIRLYSSAQLGYYGMERLLFGENIAVLDSHQTFHHHPPISAAETDAQALAKLQDDLLKMKDLQAGQLFLVFWDSTHFDYKWPKNWTPKFTPFANELAYFKTFYSQEKIELIKNRYRNSVHYIDHLFGQFIQNIPDKDEAIIIVTGDHGEEFFEHGHLFHGSHLIKEQTSIPLFMKFGSKVFNEKRRIASQMDVFPSIFDYLCKEVPSFLQGESIFREPKWPFAAISRYNAGRSPYEFCLHNGENKLIARFSDQKNILESKNLQIVSLQTAEDQILPDSHKDIHAWVKKEFGPALDRLFPQDP